MKDSSKTISRKEILDSFSLYLNKDFHNDSNRELGKALKCFKNSDDLDKAWEFTLKHFEATDFDLNSSIKFQKRWFLLKKMNIPETYNIVFQHELHSLIIPDNSIDEIEIEIELISGIKIRKAMDFMIFYKLIEEKDRIRLLKKWRKSQASIGTTDLEKNALEKCLGVYVSGTVRKRVFLCYNIGEKDYLWRKERIIFSIKHNFKYHNYPFDKHIIELDFSMIENYDVCEIYIKDDNAKKKKRNWMKGLILPKEFILNDFDLVSFAFCEPEDYPAQNISYYLSMERRPITFIWKTFIPTIFMILFPLITTFFFLLTNSFRESLLTNLIPASLIASVALQLIAGQNVPKHSGRTLEDYLFISTYFIYLILFLTAIIDKYGKFIFPLAPVFFIFIVILYLTKYFKRLKQRNLLE